MKTKETTGGKVYLTYVDQWLDTLPAADAEDFREFAEATPSVIEIWVYAGILNYPGTFNDLARWVKMKYKKLNRAALRLLRPGGLLLTCTCSGAVTKSGQFPEVVKQAAYEADREFRWLQTRGAAPDHPVNVAYQEGGAYLTAGLVSVL